MRCLRAFPHSKSIDGSNLEGGKAGRQNARDAGDIGGSVLPSSLPNSCRIALNLCEVCRAFSGPREDAWSGRRGRLRYPRHGALARAFSTGEHPWAGQHGIVPVTPLRMHPSITQISTSTTQTLTICALHPPKYQHFGRRIHPNINIRLSGARRCALGACVRAGRGSAGHTESNEHHAKTCPNHTKTIPSPYPPERGARWRVSTNTEKHEIGPFNREEKPYEIIPSDPFRWEPGRPRPFETRNAKPDTSANPSAAIVRALTSAATGGHQSRRTATRRNPASGGFARTVINSESP